MIAVADPGDDRVSARVVTGDATKLTSDKGSGHRFERRKSCVEVVLHAEYYSSAFLEAVCDRSSSASFVNRLQLWI